MCRLVLCTFSLILAIASGKPGPSNYYVSGRIVGGQSVRIDDYPYQLSLLYDGNHFCGAAIIHTNFAVTAAHCVNGLDSTKFEVRFGSSLRDEGGSVMPVSKINIHPNHRLFDYDIAILELAAAIAPPNSKSLTGVPKILRLPQPTKQGRPEGCAGSGNPQRVGEPAVASGWGAQAPGGEFAVQLQAVTVQIVSQEDCREVFGNTALTDRMLCAGVPEGGKDACNGDSGGPLVVDGELVGIVSWGRGCAQPGIPGVYANVAELRDFITDITGV